MYNCHKECMKIKQKTWFAIGFGWIDGYCQKIPWDDEFQQVWLVNQSIWLFTSEKLRLDVDDSVPNHVPSYLATFCRPRLYAWTLLDMHHVLCNAWRFTWNAFFEFGCTSQEWLRRLWKDIWWAFALRKVGGKPTCCNVIPHATLPRIKFNYIFRISYFC